MRLFLSLSMLSAVALCLLGAQFAGAAPVAPRAHKAIASPEATILTPVSAPASERPFRIDLPAAPLAPESCRLVTPYPNVASAHRSWGAFAPATRPIDPTVDGAFLGLGWSTGGLLAERSVSGYRCCSANVCHICDASGCRSD